MTDTKVVLNPGHLTSILVYDLDFAYLWELEDVTPDAAYLSGDGLVRFTWDDRGAMAWCLTRFQSPMVCSDPALGLPVVWPCVDGELHVTGRHSVGAFRAIVRGFVNGA